MLNNFIYAQTKDLFLEQLNAGNILDEAIVFIEDTKEIWNHGHYFAGLSSSGIDYEIISELQTAVAALQSDKVNKGELADYVKKNELPSLDGYLTKTVADSLYATIAQFNELSDSIDNINTELTTKLTSAALEGYAKIDDIPDEVTDTTVSDWGYMKTNTANEAYAAKDSLNNVNTDLQNFKNSVALTYATDKDVADAIANLVDSSPETLNTLDELAAALGDDPNFATTVSDLIGTKASQDALNETNTNVANLTAILDTKLDKTGGTLSSGAFDPLKIKGNSSYSGIGFERGENKAGYLVYTGGVDWFVTNEGWGIGHKIIHSGNVGEYKAGDSDKLGGTPYYDYPKALFTNDLNPLDYTSRPLFITAFRTGEGTTADYGTLIVPTWSGNQAGKYYLSELRFPLGVAPQFRTSFNGEASDWKTIAFTDSNVASAQALVHSNGMVGATAGASGGVNINGSIYWDDPSWYSIGSYMESSNVPPFGRYKFYSGHIFQTAKGEVMRINEQGNVLIGTTEDNGAKLHVDGGAAFVGGRVRIPVNGDRITFNADSGNTMGILAMNLNNAYLEAPINDAGDKVPIFIGWRDGNYAMSILKTGNVGIGLSNPQAKLHVAQDIVANGTITANGGFVGNVTGNCSGSAGSVAWGNITGRPSSLPASDVYAWAKAASKPTYTAAEVGALPTSGGIITGGTITIGSAGLPLLEGAQIPTNQMAIGRNGIAISCTDTRNDAAAIFVENISSESNRLVIAMGDDATSAQDYIVFRQYTTSGIVGHEVTVPRTSGTLALTSQIPTNTNQLTNGAGFITSSSVGNGTVTIKQNGTSKGTFTMNQSGNTTIELTDTNTHPDLSSYATQTWVNNKGYITGITKAMVTTALGYTPPSSDTNTWRPIYNGVDSTATDTSASANAVKTAYDKAVSAYNLANSKTSNTGTLTGLTSSDSGLSFTMPNQSTVTITNNAWASYTTGTISSTPNNVKMVMCTISANASFAMSTPAAGREIHVIVYNSSSADRTVSVPTSSPYVNFSGDTLTVPARGYAEINVVSNGSTMFIRHSA